MEDNQLHLYSTNTTIQPKTKVIDVSPTKAERWLRKNNVNRRLRNRVVQRYCRDIKKGRWDLNGESIKLDTEGFLIDGQHRLHACIMAGTSFRTNVTTGLPREAMKSVDIGITRSLANILELGGHKKYAPTMATITRMVAEYYELGQIFSQDEYCDTFAQNDDEITYCATFVKSRERLNSSGFSVGSLGTALLVMRDKGGVKSKVDEFVEDLITGESLTRQHPAWNLRSKMERQRRSQGQAWKVYQQIAMIFRAWNAFAEGRTLGKVYLKGKTDVHWRDIKLSRIK